MDDHRLDLDAYLQHIGYDGPRTPTLATLRGLVGCHAQTLPFENLSPLLGQPVELDVGALQRKLVEGGRGGYCYEHNLLFAEVLRAIGFEVGGLAARVVWGRGDDTITPRSHMLLRVELEGRSRIVDVGFGGLTLTGVLDLQAEVEQDTPHERFRLLPAEHGSYLMQAQLGSEWKSLYRFDLQPQERIDYEVSSWYLCHHPDSHFLQGLMAARAAPGGRVALRNNQLSVHRLGGDAQRRTLGTAAELRAVLETDLLIALPDLPELDALLERLAALPA
ncbi:arylamine N-acetyltransferase family protein [Eleftheria terrae]|uniref:arylamine N-acetyltransferase family protein n=1 Tax=Eleftheria terrae TaxID=1597781 RepID=UPI00263A6DC9|nr:arylamine N-acetyltransferase [Eleftheria terrae]WKB51497.1 arylamine N-acetyltransferase [Eleftheria terrae]